MDARFIDFCIKKNILKREDVVRAQNNMNDTMSFYEALVHMNAISQEELAINAGEFYDIQVVDLSQVTPEANALRYGSYALCRKLGFFPFAVDPVAGVLIAIADYVNVDSVRDYLQGQRVERMNFYIAPCDTLYRFIDRYLEAAKTRDFGLSMPDTPRRRASSVMHTQYISFDAAQAVPESPNVDVNAQHIATNARHISLLQKKLDTLAEENALLQQQIDKFSRMLELETQLTRQLAMTLKSSGAISAIQLDKLLNSVR